MYRDLLFQRQPRHHETPQVGLAQIRSRALDNLHTDSEESHRADEAEVFFVTVSL